MSGEQFASCVRTLSRTFRPRWRFTDGAHETKLEFPSVGRPSRARADGREFARHHIMVLSG